MTYIEVLPDIQSSVIVISKLLCAFFKLRQNKVLKNASVSAGFYYF